MLRSKSSGCIPSDFVISRVFAGELRVFALTHLPNVAHNSARFGKCFAPANTRAQQLLSPNVPAVFIVFAIRK